MTKKTKNSLVLLALGASLLSSCGKGFLEKEPSQIFSPGQIQKAAEWNDQVGVGYLNAVIATFYEPNQSQDNDHNDFAQKALDINTDLLSGDMEMPTTSRGWFKDAASLQINTTNSNTNSQIWNFSYRTVRAANSFFQGLGSDKELSSTISKANKAAWGQAKVLRAAALLNLAHVYAQPYSATTKSQRVLPLYTLERSLDAASGLATLEEVYALILEDLVAGRKALQEAGDPARSNKSKVDGTVATGFLARAYLDLGRYQEAYDEAKKVIDAGQYPLIPASEIDATGFRDVNTSEFIWGVDITKETTGGLQSFWGHMDIYTYSYAWAGDAKVINQLLQEQIPSYDVRAKWFDKRGYPTGKFYTTTKPALGADRQWLNDIIFMRTAALYLIASEAAARKGDASAAKTVLKALLKERTEPAKLAAAVDHIDQLTDAQLLDELYYQWRIELWGEGFALQVLKRFQKNQIRTTRSAQLTNQTIPYTDPRLTLSIPQSELSNNTKARQ